MFDDLEFALSPVNFFKIKIDCKSLPKKTFPSLEGKSLSQYPLPNTKDLTGDEIFAKVYMGWSKEGLEFQVDVDSIPEHVFFPSPQKGESIELFIDTRDIKTSGYNTRFCHHFFFLPEPVEGKDRGELTRFRTEDKHEHCDPSDLQLKIQKNSKGYVAKIFIPALCLVGYSPEEAPRLGVTYRINRYGNTSQNFSVVSDEYQIEEQPSLWSTIKLIS